VNRLQVFQRQPFERRLDLFDRTHAEKVAYFSPLFKPGISLTVSAIAKARADNRKF
jgi:hypothetical protein